jgi:putative PEP-CTERM system histidine kinase
MSIGVISYGLAAMNFFILFLLLLTIWRGSLTGSPLVIAIFASLLWAILSAYYGAVGLGQSSYLYQLLELIRSLAWIVVLLQPFQSLIAGKGLTENVFRFFFPGTILLSGLLLEVYLLQWGYGTGEPVVDLAQCFHASAVMCGLVMSVQLFRNTHPERLWATKYLYIGIGSIFAYDLFFYTDTLLFRVADDRIWQARGFVNALVLPLIALAAVRNPQWSLGNMFVSRRVVFGSASLMGGVLYMLLVMTLGYYIRVYGGTWGGAVELALQWVAGLLLLTVLLSARLRAKLKVFLNKHFFSYKYDYREEWLKFIGTLSTGMSDRPLRERAIHAIAEILDSTGGMLWTRQEENGNFLLTSTWNMSAQGLSSESRNSPLIKFLKSRQWIVDLDEYKENPKRYAGLDLPRWLRGMHEAWLILPLLEVNDLRGFMVLARPVAKREINWEDHDLLKTAGRQVAGYVALLDTTDALMDARQFEAFNRLSTYVVHDLKNISAQLALIVANSARHKNNPAFVEDVIHTVQNATSKMNRMLTQLRKGAPSTGELGLVVLDNVLREVIDVQSMRKPEPILTNSDVGLRLRSNRDKLATILGHLIQNAQEATGADGRVEVKAYREDGFAVIEISDDGCGMDEQFIRERLFRPFDTTKGNAGMGIGVYESREFAHAMGGAVEVISHPGSGATFFLRLPALDTHRAEQQEGASSVDVIDKGEVGRGGVSQEAVGCRR